MRNSLFLLAILFLSLKLTAQGTFTIQGEISDAQDSKVIISYEKNDTEVAIVDSFLLTNGFFKYKGFIFEPTICVIQISGKPGWADLIVKEAGTYYIAGSANSIWTAKIIGSPELELAHNYAEAITYHVDSLNLYADSSGIYYSLGDIKKHEYFSNKNREESLKIALIAQKSILSNASSYFSLFNFREISSLSRNDQQKTFLSLSDNLKSHSIGKALYYKLFVLDTLIDINQKMLPIDEQFDTSGKKIALNLLKHKYLLLDFWASWCGPCRAENEALKHLYYEFHSKGFEILGISIDNDKKKWTNAINEDNLPWINVTDLKGSKNEAAKKYGVEQIPVNFLVDETGTIIAKNLNEKELRKIIQRLFSE